MTEGREGRPLGAVLLDVGGTLWPDGFPPPARGRTTSQVERILRILPELGRELALALIDRVDARFPGGGPDLSQDTEAGIAEALVELGVGALPRDDELKALRKALIVPVPADYLFPGAASLLGTVRELGLRSVLVSNTYFRDAEDYRADFRSLGLDGVVDDVVTSVDVGCRKPHPAMFRAAIGAAGQEPEACAMVGNSEQADVEPARAMGLRTVLVAIEAPPPGRTAADEVATSLEEVATIVTRWAREPGGPG